MVMDALNKTQEGSSFHIENAKPEDVEAIRTIAKDAWFDIYPNETYGITREDIEAIDWLEPAGLERRRKEMTEKEDTIKVLVVKDDKDKILGFCKVSKDGDKRDELIQREIDAMYLVKELQGKGLGKKLMQKALEWLGTDEDIRLEVASYNTNAIDFYKRFGFQETNNPVSDKRTQLPSKKEIPRIVMVREKTGQK